MLWQKCTEHHRTFYFWAFCDVSKSIHTTFTKTGKWTNGHMFRSKRSIRLRMLKEVKDAGISLLWIAWSPVVPNAYAGPWCDPWTSVIAHQPGMTQISGFLKDEQIQGFKIIEKGQTGKAKAFQVASLNFTSKRHIHCVCLWNFVTLWHSKQFEHIHSAISWASWWHDLARWKYCTTYQGWKVVKWTSNQFSEIAGRHVNKGIRNMDAQTQTKQSQALNWSSYNAVLCSHLTTWHHIQAAQNSKANSQSLGISWGRNNQIKQTHKRVREAMQTSFKPLSCWHHLQLFHPWNLLILNSCATVLLAKELLVLLCFPSHQPVYGIYAPCSANVEALRRCKHRDWPHHGSISVHVPIKRIESYETTPLPPRICTAYMLTEQLQSCDALKNYHQGFPNSCQHGQRAQIQSL